MRVQLTLRSERDGDLEVAVDCAPGTRAGALAAALGADPRLAHRLVVDGRAVPPHATIGMPPLLAGAVVELGVRPDGAGAGDDSPDATRRWELRVESGPDVGLRLALGSTPSVLGRGRELTLRVCDPAVSRRHIELRPALSGVTVRDLGGANGTSVNGQPVGSIPVPLMPGDALRVGSTTASLHPVPRKARHLPSDGEGHLIVDPVTAPPTAPPVAVTLPGPPPDRERSRFPWLALLIPLALAGGVAAVMHSPTVLLFGLTGPLLSFGTWVTTRRGSRRRTQDEAKQSDIARRAAAAQLEVARSAERRALIDAHPTLAALLTLVETRARDLWATPADRSASGPLDVRLGMGSPASRLQVTGEATAPLLADSPVTVDLASLDLVALLGHRSLLTSAATNVVARLAAQHAPSRVEIYVLVGGAAEAADWSFARLLPQVVAVTLLPAATSEPMSSAPGSGSHRPDHAWLAALKGLSSVADQSHRRPRVMSGGRLVGERDPPEPPPRHLVVLDGGPALLRTPTARTALRLASESGITVMVLGEVPTSGVPKARTAIVTLTESSRRTDASLVIGGGDPTRLVPDRPGKAYAWRLARALAALREADRRPVSAEIPDRVRLLDLIVPDDEGTSPPGASLSTSSDRLEHHVVRQWGRRPRSTSAVLGVSAAGTFTVDLAADGPHALVGGTTGAGKSELLQTLVASLALANRPDEMSFVLIDYKGGAAFRDCAQLPHVVGWVTDLDSHLTRRALLSLGAEVRRRERTLAAAGVPDLEAYQARRDHDDPDRHGPDHHGPDHHDADRGALVAVPRLMIVIDEFRVLAELPDFVPGLVRLATVGRSLGIHLVLATQRPGGIVTADIRANVSLRIALRVRDRTDSVDIIEAPDAAAVSAETPGRAFLRGGATDLTQLQAARVTGGRSTEGRLAVVDVTQWWQTPRPFRGASPAPPASPAPHAPPTPAADHPRDLDDIVTATWGATRLLGVPRPAPPWLPPLPDALDLSDVAAPPGSVPVGLVDVPDRQVRQSWCWPADGHLGIAGGPGSGRTTAMRTIAGALATAHSPTEVHLYAIGPPALASLTALPHTAAVAGLHDADHARLVVERLVAVVGERLTSPPSGQWPRVVVLVDGWEQLVSLDGGSVAGELRVVLEAGRTVGVVAVVAGGRAVLSGQLAALFSSRLVLRVTDPVDLAMAGVPAKMVPVHQPPGRALVVASHEEVQIALLGGRPDATGQDAELAAIALRWTWAPDVGTTRAGAEGAGAEGAGGGGLPRPVHRLPALVTASRRAPLADAVALGVREGDLETVHLPLARGHRRFVVVGSPGSGRTTTLATVASGLLSSGRPLAVLGRDLVQALHPPDATLVLALSGTATNDVDRLIAARRAHPGLCVLVDDVEQTSTPALDVVLREVARLVDEDDGLLVAATTPAQVEGRASPLVNDLTAGRAGVLLRARPGSHLLGIVVPARAGAQPDPPGRGLLVGREAPCRIQVARW